MKPKHPLLEIVDANSIRALAALVRLEAKNGSPWNVMLLLAAHYAKQYPADAWLMEAFANWREGLRYADELMPKAAARLKIEHRAREKAAAKKRAIAAPIKRQRQDAADEIWGRKPHLSKAAVAQIIAEKMPKLGKAGTIADQIIKPPTVC